MLFSIDGDSGSRIEGWIMPDNPSVTPSVLVFIANELQTTIKAHVLRPLLREQGLHDTGVCGFVLDVKNCPNLAGAEDVEIFDADTNIRIYRRRPLTADVDAKLFRLEGQLLRNAAFNETLEPHFHMVFTKLDALPEETAKSILGIPYSPSIYVTGRVYYRVFEPLLRDRGFQTCLCLRDPLEEMAEQLLLIQWASTRQKATLKGVLSDGFLELVALTESEMTSAPGRLEAWLSNLPPRARAMLANPMTRLLTCMSSDERPALQAVADALDTLAGFMAVGFRDDVESFVATIEGGLDRTLPVITTAPPARRVTHLAAMLGGIGAVDQMLALDRELYQTARAAFTAADAPENVRG